MNFMIIHFYLKKDNKYIIFFILIVIFYLFTKTIIIGTSKIEINIHLLVC